MADQTADKPVQPILVATDGSHEDTVTAAALASTNAWLTDPDNPAWGEWLAFRFTKSVRRIRPAKLATVADAHGLPVTHVGDATAVAFPPMLYSDYPSEIARAQVSGTDFLRKDSWAPHPTDLLATVDWPAILVLNPTVADTMSTGKTAAQAAHALLLYTLNRHPARTAPLTADDVTIFRAETETDFASLMVKTPILIQDAGLTEINPGTVTFLAY